MDHNHLHVFGNGIYPILDGLLAGLASGHDPRDFFVLIFLDDLLETKSMSS